MRRKEGARSRARRAARSLGSDAPVRAAIRASVKPEVLDLPPQGGIRRRAQAAQAGLGGEDALQLLQVPRVKAGRVMDALARHATAQGLGGEKEAAGDGAPQGSDEIQAALFAARTPRLSCFSRLPGLLRSACTGVRA